MTMAFAMAHMSKVGLMAEWLDLLKDVLMEYMWTGKMKAMKTE